MSTTISVVPTVAAQLGELLAVALATAGENYRPVDIYDSFPPSFASWDACIIGDQVDGAHEYASLKAGRKTRQETYIQQIWFRVIRPGAQSTNARNAAFAQLGALEDMIADAPGIGLTEPTLVLNVQGFSCNTTQDAGSMGWLAVLRADVYVSVRLT